MLMDASFVGLGKTTWTCAKMVGLSFHMFSICIGFHVQPDPILVRDLKPDVYKYKFELKLKLLRHF